MAHHHDPQAGNSAVAEPSIAFTNVGKVLFPATGFTKGDLLQYYQRIAPVMIHHLEGRPVTVKRCPDGVNAETFYEKRCPAKRPDWVTTAKIASAHHGVIEFCVVDHLATLLWQANRAAIEFHPYLYRAEDEDAPTQVVFDLDPGPERTVIDCCAVALRMRDLLNGMRLTACIKTSGGKGLHIGVPVRGATFAETKAFAHQVASTMARNDPAGITDIMAKTQRTGRIFIDWSQNDHGKTTACAYTVRVLDEPWVSTPVAWTEIEEALKKKRPNLLRFEPAQVVKRVDELGDLQAPMIHHLQKLPKTAGIS